MERRALLTGVAAGATTVLAGCAGSLFGDPIQETRDHRFRVSGDLPVRAVTGNGDVELAAASGQEVVVDATVTVPTEDRLGDVRVEGREADGRFDVVAVVDGDTSRVSVDLRVEVPEDHPVAGAESENGDVTARSVAGVGSYESENGDVTVQDVAGVALARTRNGDVDAEVPAPVEGDVAVRSQNGDVEAALDPGLDAAVTAQTTNGDVEVSGLDLEDANVSETEVAGTLGDGTHEVSVETENGDVELRAL